MSASTTDGRLDALDALDAAAVGLLEPLIAAIPFDAGSAAGAAPGAGAADGGWRSGLALALDRLALAARPLELAGLAQTASMLAGHLRETSAGAYGESAGDAASAVLGDRDAALELALAEGWVGDAIAFCSGQLASDDSANLIGRLRDWPGLERQLTPERASAIALRLRADARRIGNATLESLPARAGRDGEDDVRPERADARPGAERLAGADADDAGFARGAPGERAQETVPGRASPPQAARVGDAQEGAVSIGADELRMLAEAASQLDEEFREALDDGVDFESFAQIGDAIERYASAIAYVGLVAVSDAWFAWQRNLERFANEPTGFGAQHRTLLERLPALWSALFAAPSIDAARRALAPIADPAWPVPVDPPTLDAARRAFGAIVTVGTRRVSVGDDDLDEASLSLAIPPDADRDVVDNLLRELPLLSTAFSASIERAQAGSRDDLAEAQRIAHTLKGSANTVGVRGIAALTHRLEDLLQLLEAVDEPLAPALAHVLSDAADCLAEMSEAVAGLGGSPADALDVHRRVREWIARLLESPEAARASAASDALASSAPTAPTAATSSAPTAAATTDPAASPAAADAASPLLEPAPSASPSTPVAEPAQDARSAPGADAASHEWLRVPASLIERLLAFANEASILLSQAQEQAVEVDRVRSTLVGGTDQLQDLAAELERLVDLRGSMLSDRREREDFDPLELDEHNDLQMVSRRIAESGADGRLIEQQLGRNVAALRDSLSQLERLQVDLREAALQTRTVRIDTIVPRWMRTVRQAARMALREAALHVEGETIEIDSQLLQALVEPIGHLLRNAVDHGIEAPSERERLGKPRAGRVTLRFARDGGDLLIECGDDGRGLDLAAVRARAIALGLVAPDDALPDAALARFVLASGFSTRERATQLSGRGIGLDVVERTVREQRGSIDLDTQPGAGMRVRLRLPLRLAALPVVVVRSSTHVLGLSVRDVERILAENDAATDAPHPDRLVRLEDVLGLPEDAFAPAPGTETGPSVVLEVRMPAGERIGVRVPEPGQPRNVVLRPLAAFVPSIPGLEGATVLGDGAVAPVYDLPRLLALREGARARPALRATRPALPVCLVVDDSVSVRRMMEQFVRDLGYQPDSAGDGVEALEHVQRRVPSIVLVDLEMPRMNGVEFVRALRADAGTRHVPVVMITSRSSDKHRALARDAGVDVFLTKPYTEDALASHITALLQARSADR